MLTKLIVLLSCTLFSSTVFAYPGQLKKATAVVAPGQNFQIEIGNLAVNRMGITQCETFYNIRKVEIIPVARPVSLHITGFGDFELKQISTHFYNYCNYVYQGFISVAAVYKFYSYELDESIEIVIDGDSRTKGTMTLMGVTYKLSNFVFYSDVDVDVETAVLNANL